MEKRPLVLLSGGLDSTYLVYSMLQYRDVEVLYVSGPQGNGKIRAEAMALEKIYKWLKKNCKFDIIKKHKVALNESYQHNNILFGQPVFWLTGGLLCNSSDIDSFNVGYVAGDQMLCHIGDLENAWNSLSKITLASQSVINFPLKYKSKQEILSDMPPALVKLTWSCEIPILLASNRGYKECGMCAACVKKFNEKLIFNHRNKPLSKYQQKKHNLSLLKELNIK